MLLKTFLKRLVVQPTTIRHDAYDGKDFLKFEKHDGYFPYIEFQSTPKDGKQEVYIDVLNWDFDNSKYISSKNSRTFDFVKIIDLSDGY